MRKLLVYLSIFSAASCIISACKTNSTAAANEDRTYEVATYVYSGATTMPDPTTITTINYAFGNVNSTLDGVTIGNEDRFRQIIALKEINPDLKVLLSLGGNSASGFSAVAADSAKRAVFAGSLRKLIADFGINGIDFDWEFPGGEGGTPDDRDNFTLLLQAVRDSIGTDHLLTLAGGGDLPGVDAEKVTPILDYYNVMAYDLGGQAPWHHTALYRSVNTGWRSVDEVVQYYLSLGIPYEKMLLGLGFYGRGDDHYYKGWTSYEASKPYDDLTVEWDSVACVPYIADAEGHLVLGYDDPRSLEIKCDYIKEHGFRGAMCWRTELDEPELPLAHTVARCLLGK